MSLRHALLGVLKDRPLTGYDLIRHFQGTLGFLWSAPQSQIYPELPRMEAGMAELRRWASDFMPLPAHRDPVHLKAAFFDLAPLDSVHEQLRAHIAQFQWRLDQWQTREEAIRQRRAEITCARQGLALCDDIEARRAGPNQSVRASG